MYPRDLMGYGETPPYATGQMAQKIAVQVVLNFEEGGENCILHGDESSEAFLSNPQRQTLHRRASHEHGIHLRIRRARRIWRLRRIFTERNIPLSVFGVGMALARHPAAVAAMKAAGWEIASHGWRWIDYSFMDEKTECEHLKKALETHIAAVARRPLDGISVAPAPIPDVCFWKWANGFMTPTVMPMTCLIGRRAKTASRI